MRRCRPWFRAWASSHCLCSNASENHDVGARFISPLSYIYLADWLVERNGLINRAPIPYSVHEYRRGRIPMGKGVNWHPPPLIDCTDAIQVAPAAPATQPPPLVEEACRSDRADPRQRVEGGHDQQRQNGRGGQAADDNDRQRTRKETARSTEAQ